MSARPHPRLETWRDSHLVVSDDARQSADNLSRHVSIGEEMLAELPPKPARTRGAQRLAETIHDGCRMSRLQFMRRHALWLYSALTDNRTAYRQLDELTFRAAEIVPGLVPTREQLRRESDYSQSAKEGREIDQGIFFWGLLRNAESGPHLLDALRLPTPKAQAHLREFVSKGRLQLSTMTVERRGCAAHLTVQNASCLNAEDNQLIADMETAVDLALLDDQVSVGVLRGGTMNHPKYRGRRVFSAGINLKSLAQGQISFVNFLLQRELGYISKIQRGLVVPESDAAWNRRHVEKPWVAAVDTFAIGGGAQLLLVFDRVIATNDSFVSLPAAQEGIVPGVANLRLSRLAGGRVARQVILFGRKLDASEPDAALLIDRIVQSCDMESAIDEAIEQLDNAAVRTNRKMLNLAEESVAQFQSYMAEFALEQSQRLYSDDVIAKVSRPIRNA